MNKFVIQTLVTTRPIHCSKQSSVIEITRNCMWIKHGTCHLTKSQIFKNKFSLIFSPRYVLNKLRWCPLSYCKLGKLIPASLIKKSSSNFCRSKLPQIFSLFFYKTCLLVLQWLRWISETHKWVLEIFRMQKSNGFHHTLVIAKIKIS